MTAFIRVTMASMASLLGFDGLDDLGNFCTTLDPEDASALGQYVSTLAHILHQED
jgi:hypothetical protein